MQHPLHPPVGSALPWQGAGSHCSSHYTQGCRGSVQSDGSSVTPLPQWHKSAGPAHVLLAPCAVAAAVGGGAAVSPPCCSPAWHLCVVACEQWADSVTLINTGSAMALCVCVLYVPHSPPLEAAPPAGKPPEAWARGVLHHLREPEPLSQLQGRC